MNSKEMYITKIINTLKNDVDKANFSQPVSQNIDPFLFELKKILAVNYEENLKNDPFLEIDNQPDTLVLENNKINNLQLNSSEILIIKERIHFLLHKVNLDFFKNRKEEIINLILSYFFDKNNKLKLVDDDDKIITTKYITEYTEEEFNKYKLQKDVKMKEILNDILNKITPDINNFFILNPKNKLETISIYQRNNFIKYFLNGLYEKYLNLEKRINNEDYSHLKLSIKKYFLNKYNKIISPELNDE